ncbi:hypothetical protein Bhyg_08146 [Pseudolycoriella hygida]|uniref:Uncharacterized protein n=1 Tax=Pseudolycoriella hygida TaxID=35572 RepID=A0A9Q0N455_9DIPT|nr:hypothetical protein Bhyg_08146 [Pseudolycoriella hygida]
MGLCEPNCAQQVLPIQCLPSTMMQADVYDLPMLFDAMQAYESLDWNKGHLPPLTDGPTIWTCPTDSTLPNAFDATLNKKC